MIYPPVAASLAVSDPTAVAEDRVEIVGWCDFLPFYREMVGRFREGGRFVEVGCWHGQSSVSLLKMIGQAGAEIAVDFIDTWLASPNEPEMLAELERLGPDHVYESFLANVAPYAGWRAIRKRSVEAAADYEDASLDFVFIDADHSAEAVEADVRAWLPKVKPGGVLAGHDADYDSVRAGLSRVIWDWRTVGRCWVKEVA